jgi:transposase
VGMSGDNSSREFSIVAETRRRWSEAEKAAIVAEASGPCTNVSAVARRHGIKPPLLFRWMKERAVALAHANPSIFMPVVVSQMTKPGPPGLVTSESAAKSEPASGACETIEISLRNGRRVRVGVDMDGQALKRIIDLLEV